MVIYVQFNNQYLCTIKFSLVFKKLKVVTLVLQVVNTRLTTHSKILLIKYTIDIKFYLNSLW